MQPFDLRFVSINGSVGPNARGSSGTGQFSGAYLGGDGRDQFYVLHSNMTSGTPLPPWTDRNFFYLPSITIDDGESAKNDQFQIETTTLGAELECNVVNTTEMRIKLTQDGYINLNMTVRRGEIGAECSSDRGFDTPRVYEGPEGPDSCQLGASALELIVGLNTLNPNSTQKEKDVCLGTVVLGWARKPQGTCKSSSQQDFDAINSLFIQCQPRLMRGKYSHRFLPRRGWLLECSNLTNRPCICSSRYQRAPGCTISDHHTCARPHSF